MSATDLQDGLARYLSGQWGTAVTVSNAAESSAGARRRNVLFDADDGQTIHRLVATIIPNPAMQIMAIATEAALLRLAHAGGVPVAEVLFDTDDGQFVGGPFFITRRVDGESLSRRVLRLVQQSGNGERVATQLGSAFAALHRVPLAQAPAALVRPELAPAEHALSSVSTQVSTLLQPSPVFSLALRWLAQRLPRVPRAVCIVHGDVRNGNVIVTEQGLAAILDWETTRCSDPMEDLAWVCLRCWRFGADDVEVGGFGGRAAMVQAYEAGGGIFDLAAWHWWKVLGTLRWGLGLAGQARQHLDGSVPSIVMATSGRRVAELEYDLLCLLEPAGAVVPDQDPTSGGRH